MKQIERYIFGRIAALTIWSLIAITTLSLTTQILLRVDILTTSGSTLFTFVQLALTLVPEVLLVIAPFSLIIGVARILTTMNEDSELVVIEAAGVSNISIVRPVMLFSTLMAVFLLFVANILGPMANRQLYTILSGANADILSIAVSSGGFQEVEDGLHIQIAQSLSGGAMSGIFLADRRDPNAELIIYAKSGAIIETESSELLQLQNGEIHRRAGLDEQISIVRFETYALDLSSLLPSAELSELRPKELYLSELINPDTSRSNYETFKRFYPFEIHSRLGNWLYAIVFGAVLVVFLGGAQSHRGQHYKNIAAAVGLCVAIRLIGNIAVEETKTNQMAVIAVYAIPLIAIMFFLYLALSGKKLSLPKSWIALLDDMETKISSLAVRRKKRSPKEASEPNRAHGVGGQAS